MGYRENYKKWLESDVLSAEDKRELEAIGGDEAEIEERFYRELEFGTAGMRGIIGMGTNRINIYNVRRATCGVAAYIAEEGEKAAQAGVLIGYDTRNFSKKFAEETACVLCAHKIKTYLFPTVHSVPEVSFGIRELGCAAGVMITASHNPKEYNGYKVYGPDGGQMPPEAVKTVTDAIEKCDVFGDVPHISLDEAVKSGLLSYVDAEQDEKFIKTVMLQQVKPEAVYEVADTMKLIYTPFHGTGSRPVKEVLKRIGFKNVLVVKEQDTEDGDFPTVKSPNPENKEGFAIAIEMAKANDVDIIIGTDPDCDRVGIVVRDAEGEYRALTGNQTGALMAEYILRAKKESKTLPDNGVIIKTIVTTELAAEIAKAYGAEIVNTLTGFKYIGEKMTEYAKTGAHTYLMGFEESYGYLVGTHARDKDGVVASMLIAEMAAYYKTKGMSPYEALCDIYKKYGYFAEKTVSFTMPGKDGMEKMAALMAKLREEPVTACAGLSVTESTDFANDETGLPKSDVIRYRFSDGKSQIIVRPSGTEPKIKLYISTSAQDEKAAADMRDALLCDIKAQLGV